MKYRDEVSNSHSELKYIYFETKDKKFKDRNKYKKVGMTLG